MPANLTPQYLSAEKRYREAREDAEKLRYLEEMIRLLPKHKGTDHLFGDLKARRSKLLGRLDQAKKQGKREYAYGVERQGAGQVLLLGVPNSGKSSLLNALSNANSPVGEYPFTTHKPYPGMMPYKDVHVQVVDVAPVVADATEAWVQPLARSADEILIVVDAADPDCLEHVETVLAELDRFKVTPCLYGDPQLRNEPVVPRTTLLVANKCDVHGAADDLAVLRELYADRFPILAVSSTEGAGLHDLVESMYASLRVIRVYTKAPGRPPDTDAPYVLREGATVFDLAEEVHREIAESFKSARMWGTEVHDGQLVGRDHVLADGDVVEIHT